MHHVMAGEAAQNNGKNEVPCTMLWPAKRHRITVKTKGHKRKGYHAPCYGQREGVDCYGKREWSQCFSRSTSLILHLRAN